jgi:hypothetical protein
MLEMQKGTKEGNKMNPGIMAMFMFLIGVELIVAGVFSGNIYVDMLGIILIAPLFTFIRYDISNINKNDEEEKIDAKKG